MAMTTQTSMPKLVQKINSSIEKKKIKVLELQSELVRKKVKENYHELYDFDLKINNFIQDIQRIKNKIAKKGVSEDDIYIEYKQYYDDVSVSVYYYRDETDEEYEQRTQPIQVKIKKVQVEIENLQNELDEMQKFFEQSCNK